ncbi:unnamed protein product, partial [Symbiodinium sp. CCMP2456]
GDEWVIATPDEDIYTEELARHNPDVQYMWHSPDGRLARGVFANQVYGFAPMTAAQYAALMRLGRTELDAELRRRGLGAAGVPAHVAVPGGGAGPPAVAAARVGGAAVAPAPAAAPVAVPPQVQGAAGNIGPGAQDLTGLGLVWVAAEATANVRYGEQIHGVAAPAVAGGRVVHTMPDGSELFCLPASCDGRILPRVFNALGQPERPLAEVVAASTEVEMGWKLTGPRTTLWCLNYLAVEGLGFEAHHERLRQLCRVDSNAWGIQEHFQMSMVLRQLVLVDQVDACNCYGVELLFRRLQTIEYSHSERARELEGKTVGGKLSLEEQYTFGSLVRQVEKDVQLAKNMRKAREAIREDFCGARRTKRRLERRLHQDGMVADCVRGLNALYSGGKVGSTLEHISSPSQSQLAALKHIRNSVQLLGAPTAGLDGREALRQLQAFDGYGEVPPVPLDVLLGDDGMRVVEVEFVRRLVRSGLVELTETAPLEKIEMFFARKKDGRLRMVIDCRRSNEWFVVPDKVHLATAEVLSRIDLGGSAEELHIATADLKDAFYHFELPPALRPYFGMRTVTAADMEVRTMGGRPVRSTHLLHPRLKVLPMGWSEELYSPDGVISKDDQQGRRADSSSGETSSRQSESKDEKGLRDIGGSLSQPSMPGQVLEDFFDEGEDLSQGQYLIAAVQFYQMEAPGPAKVETPVAVGGVGGVQMWSLILHPAEFEVPSKTGEFDESVLFDLTHIQWIAQASYRLHEVGERSAPAAMSYQELVLFKKYRSGE